MSKAAARAIDAKLAKLGEGSALQGEQGDRLFKAHGRNWRVRVRVRDELPPAAPVNGAPLLSPEVVSVSISVAALRRGKVAKDKSGRLLVFAASVLTLQKSAFAQRDFDPKREILNAAADQIAAANAQIKGRSRLPDALAAWTAKG